jgi:hypothetical protein
VCRVGQNEPIRWTRVEERVTYTSEMSSETARRVRPTMSRSPLSDVRIATVFGNLGRPPVTTPEALGRATRKRSAKKNGNKNKAARTIDARAARSRNSCAGVSDDQRVTYVPAVSSGFAVAAWALSMACTAALYLARARFRRAVFSQQVLVSPTTNSFASPESFASLAACVGQ